MDDRTLLTNYLMGKLTLEQYERQKYQNWLESLTDEQLQQESDRVDAKLREMGVDPQTLIDDPSIIADDPEIDQETRESWPRIARIIKEQQLFNNQNK